MYCLRESLSATRVGRQGLLITQELNRSDSKEP